MGMKPLEGKHAFQAHLFTSERLPNQTPGGDATWGPQVRPWGHEGSPPTRESPATRVPQVRSARITKGTQSTRPRGKVPRDHEEGARGDGNVGGQILLKRL